jgi:hypothetical protein
MLEKGLAVILLVLAIAAVGFAVYRTMPHRDQDRVSIENVWKALIP